MIVLDTQSLIWWSSNSKRLSKAARSAINRHEEVVIPAICCWEYAFVAIRGEIRLTRPVAEALAEILGAPGISMHPLTTEIAIRGAQLSPGAPMDPADQLVAATALVLNVPLITSDERLHAIPGLKTIW